MKYELTVSDIIKLNSLTSQSLKPIQDLGKVRPVDGQCAVVRSFLNHVLSMWRSLTWTKDKGF